MCLGSQNEAAFDEIFQQANFNTFVFRNRVKLETYNVSKAVAAAAVIALTRRPTALLSWHHTLQYYLNKTKERVSVTAQEEEKEEEKLGEHPSLEIVFFFFIIFETSFRFMNASAFCLTLPAF